MRQLLMAVLALLFCLMPRVGSAEGSKPAPTTAARDDGWPTTKAGSLGRGWVTAFSTGDSAMKRFLATEMATKSLEERSVNQRIARYQDLREKYGRLELGSVVKSTPDKLTVKLMDRDGKLHEFTFTAQTEAPYKLVLVSVREHHFGHGGH